MKNIKSNILKIAIFATGLSGIVAEYILSTLASYFLGDSVVQWALTVSFMLFAMGVGSRITRLFDTNLVLKFITIEFLLSILVAVSPLITYTAASFTSYIAIIIYSLSILIGMMIGMEIPLVIRVNSELEILRVNVSSVIENDYYGSLLGGLFFVFVGLPYLGLTYTPFILAGVNFSVAIMLFFIVREQIHPKGLKWAYIGGVITLTIILSGLYYAEPIIMWGEQVKYKDKIVFSEQSRYQKIVVTRWQNNYWLYINGNQQLSTMDEFMYHEPIIHPAMKLSKEHNDILVLGGGDGCAVREILKYPDVKSITVVDLDKVMTDLAATNSIFTELNNNSFNSDKVKIINTDAFNFVEQTRERYDVIVVDLPDPRSVELNRMYSKEFYELCYRIIRPHGAIITQAGSPYFATKAFLCVDTTLSAAGFNTARLHNQIVTMGEWGWIIGSKSVEKEKLKSILNTLEFDDIKLRWLNNEAMQLMTSFGKNIYGVNYSPIEVNTIRNPVLYRYYLEGNWDLY